MVVVVFVFCLVVVVFGFCLVVVVFVFCLVVVIAVEAFIVVVLGLLLVESNPLIASIRENIPKNINFLRLMLMLDEN